MRRLTIAATVAIAIGLYVFAGFLIIYFLLYKKQNNPQS